MLALCSDKPEPAEQGGREMRGALPSFILSALCICISILQMFIHI